MNSDSQNLFVFALAVLFLLGFSYLSGNADIQTIRVKDRYTKADSAHKKLIKDSLTKKLDGTYSYFNNALTGLVGGIVAIGFGQAPPPTLPSQNKTPVSAGFISLGSLLVDNKKNRGTTLKNIADNNSLGDDKKKLLGIVYSFGYLLLGVFAIGTWIYAGDDLTPSLVKSLATVSFGLMLSIITAYFRTPSQ